MIVLKNALILSGEKLIKKDILIEGGIIAKIADFIYGDDYIDCNECWVIPGTIDIHAHFREPGFERKGTILSESKSAAKGGIVTAMAMPNLNPAPDCLSSLRLEKDIIKKDALINIYPYAAISKGELGKEISDLDGMENEINALSDDGRGVNNIPLLRQAMAWAKAHGKVIASHAEMEGYGTIPQAEYLAVQRELALVKEIGCKYHFCHISTKQAFNLIKQAQLNGVSVTCEVTPHHLTLCEDDVCGNTNYKMNPPLRTKEDMQATIDALLDGTATVIATDHAPHSKAEKSTSYESAPCGIIGFETALPVCYTALVKTGLATPKRFLEWTVYNPAAIMGLPVNKIAEGERADIAVLDINNPHIYTEEEILSKAVNSPFIGKEYYGFNRLTIKDGKIIYGNI